MRVLALFRLGLCAMCILLVPRVAFSNVVYHFIESSCDSLFFGPCASEGYWVLSDSALDDGIATGEPEILGFHFVITNAAIGGGSWNLSHITYGPLSNIRLYGDAQNLTQLETISPSNSDGIDFRYGSPGDSVEVDSSGGYTNIYVGNSETFFAIFEGEWANTSPVPLPASLWLFLSGLGGLKLLARRRRIVQ